MDLGLLVATAVVIAAVVVAVLFLPNWALGSAKSTNPDAGAKRPRPTTSD
jgi:hypothetical protein